MSWGWFFAIVIAMVAGAALFEVWLRRGTRRPLSRHAARQRRWDDPNRPDEEHAQLKSERAVGRLGSTQTRQWRFPLDPQKQARALMPGHARRQGKEGKNDE